MNATIFVGYEQSSDAVTELCRGTDILEVLARAAELRQRSGSAIGACPAGELPKHEDREAVVYPQSGSDWHKTYKRQRAVMISAGHAERREARMELAP